MLRALAISLLWACSAASAPIEESHPPRPQEPSDADSPPARFHESLFPEHNGWYCVKRFGPELSACWRRETNCKDDYDAMRSATPEAVVLPCRHVARAACFRVMSNEEDITLDCSLTQEDCQTRSEWYRKPGWRFFHECELTE